MGRLRQQIRGKGTPKYRAPSHRYAGKIGYPTLKKDTKFEIIKLINSIGHKAPLMLIKSEDNEALLPAPLSVREGQMIQFGKKAQIKVGNITQLDAVPPGTPMCNLERIPGDGGTIMRTSGTAAFVVEKVGKLIKIKLPSKKIKLLDGRCRVTIGKVAGGGRRDKPYLKAGSKHKAMLAVGKLHPRVHGVAMNPPDHPHGKTHRRHKGGPTTVKATASPGQKVGKLSKKRRKK